LKFTQRWVLNTAREVYGKLKDALKTVGFDLQDNFFTTSLKIKFKSQYTDKEPALHDKVLKIEKISQAGMVL